MECNDIKEIKKLLGSLITITTQTQSDITEIKQDIKDMKERLNKVEKDAEQFKKVMSKMEARIIEAEMGVDTVNSVSLNQSAALNALEQTKLATRLMILNIPDNIEADKAVTAIGNWANFNLSTVNLKSARIIGKERNKSLHLEFWQEQRKSEFFDKVKMIQKDTDGGYKPVLCEHVFDIDTTSASRGKELHFRRPMTEVNRSIFNEARKYKDSFKYVWIGGNGYIMGRKDEKSSAIIIHSMQQLVNITKQN